MLFIAAGADPVQQSQEMHWLFYWGWSGCPGKAMESFGYFQRPYCMIKLFSVSLGDPLPKHFCRAERFPEQLSFISSP
jgi:hypothetical protein